MRVHRDQARHNGFAGDVNYLRTLRCLDLGRRADRGDLVALDDDRAIFDGRVAGAVDNAGTLENDYGLGIRGVQKRCRETERE